MKIPFIKIQNSFKKKKSEINPNTFWSYILYMSFVLIIFAFAFGFYVFTTVNDESTLSPEEQSEQISKVKKERIEKVLEYYVNKKMKSVEIINFPTGIVDPSL